MSKSKKGQNKSQKRNKRTQMKHRLSAMVRRKRLKEKLKASLPMLQTVAHRKKGYQILLKDPTNDVVTIFCNCARNLLKGNAQLNQIQMKRLSRHRDNIRALASPRTSKIKKKKIIQKGGFLPF